MKTLSEMYSTDYSTISVDIPFENLRDYSLKFRDLQKYLKSESNGRIFSFLDIGCGFNPVTLQIAANIGYEVHGVEFSKDVVNEANEKGFGPVMEVEKFKSSATKFDYIFMGDVIEHFVNPISEIRETQERITPGGYLIAQGPLQGAQTLSHIFVNLKSQMSRSKVSFFPPYHVSLATRQGMITVMKSGGFEIVKMSITEEDWPAPTFNSMIRNFTLRKLALFITKLLDKMVSRLLPKYGSHYFLIAKKKN
jgi:SAM-dependent methyltransferase